MVRKYFHFNYLQNIPARWFLPISAADHCTSMSRKLNQIAYLEICIVHYVFLKAEADKSKADRWRRTRELSQINYF